MGCSESLANIDFRQVTGHSIRTEIRQVRLETAKRLLANLCEGFAHELSEKLGMPIYGVPERFEVLVKAMLEFSRDHPITVVIDEFREFLKISKSVFSALQHYWDVLPVTSTVKLSNCPVCYTCKLPPHKLYP